MPDRDMHLAAIVDGDADAFASWMSGTEARLRASVGRFAADVDTEAVVQETLLRVWQVAHRHRPDGRPDSLLRLAIRIARNLAIDEIRRQRSVATDEAELQRLLDHATAASDWRGPDPLLRQRIQECLNRLGGRPLVAMMRRMTDVGALPDEAIAESMTMTRNTFLQNISRARRQLAKCLEDRGVDLEGAWR